MRRLLLATLCAAVTLPALADDASERAQALADKLLIADTHIDVPYRMKDAWVDATKATAGGDFDLPRAQAGGLDLAFMSIYVPASMESAGGSWQLANELIDFVQAMVFRAPDHLALAASTADVERAVAAGKLALALGMENGAPIEGKLENLKFFHDRGIRYITLAHSESNHISDSSYDENKRWQGLSDFGRQVVAEMNRLGIIIDVSHVSDDAFHQVIELSKAPVLATHSSARHYTPGFERNMSDEMIVKLAENGGVIQINFGSSFLSKEANEYSQAFFPARASFIEEQGIEADDPAVEAFTEQYRKEHPYPYATLETVLDHIDHVVKLTSVDHVGIGSDYDGVGDSLPVGLKDVSDYPNLVDGLLARGYSEADIAKILGGNTMRVWKAVEAAAE